MNPNSGMPATETIEYSPTYWYEQVGVNGLNEQTDFMITQTRLLLHSDRFLWHPVSYPNGPVTDSGPNGGLFLSGTTKEDTISVPVGSFLHSVSGYSNLGPFQLTVIDNGSKTTLFNRTFGISTIAAPDLTELLGTGMPFGPKLLTAPYIVTPPGQIFVQITNPLAASAIVQILLEFAIPKGEMQRKVGGVNSAAREIEAQVY